MKQEIWLYIWRFQPFHNGHKRVIDTMLGSLQENIICIGISEGKKKNPYDYELRKKSIEESFQKKSKLHIFPLPDMPSDKEWIESILAIPAINRAKKIVIFGGDLERDSAIQVISAYKNLFSPRILEIREISRNILPLSGTEIREKIEHIGLESVKDDIPSGTFSNLKNL